MSKESNTSFEAAMAELEEILAKLNGDEITLDESIALYSTAAALVQQCNKRLAHAKVQIEEIGKSLEEGQE